MSDTPIEAPQDSAANREDRDIVGMGIVIAAILMFVGTAGVVVPHVVAAINGDGPNPNNILVTALLLNIALILFSWHRYRMLSQEVVVRRKSEEQARTLAITDPLTGCLNRRAIGERTAMLIAHAQRRDKSVAFLMLDLDNFKNINDIQGHDTGDKVLVEIAERMRKVCPPHSLVARLGGDEFACSMAFDPAYPQAVQRVAEDIIEAIAQPVRGAQADHGVTASIGISRADLAENNIELMMRRADIAMYYSKRQGRNRFTWFDQAMENEVQFRSKIESGIRRGIPNGEFVPYYEQQVDIESGRLLGFEVLARWNSPDLGLVSPNIFIPIAEETNMIGELSQAVMRQAMQDAKGWDPELTISVNISPVQLRDPWLAQKIVKLLVETGFPANRLEIEITESCLFENIGLAQSIIGSLKNQGVRIALDDFGTGYSSLAHLRALPFDRIKIDRSFVSSISHSKESAAIVRTITLLGESMGLPITAEGIENQSIVDDLKKLGCGKGQGFHYGRPLAIEQVRRLLAEQDLLTAKRTETAETEADQASLFDDRGGAAAASGSA